MLDKPTPLQALTYSVSSSALVVDDITALTISETVRMAPLLGGECWLFER